MPKIQYIEKRFNKSSLRVIEQANSIIDEYHRQGFDLTLRQLYYQFVARDLIANSQKEYKKLGGIINDARLAGMVDWEAIVDRTRNLKRNSHWTSPAQIVEACAEQYQIDKWAGQKTRVEVWIEKDALVGVIAGICGGLDVPYFSCRGYTSQSEMWEAGQRLKRFAQNGQESVIIHLGDHDPSGIDMSRDVEERIRLFMGKHEGVFSFKRVALNMDQVRKYSPPPNPAKLTDTRSDGYIRIHGDESWELDALDPRTLSDLVQKNVLKYREEDAWEESKETEADHKSKLEKAASKLRKE